MTEFITPEELKKTVIEEIQNHIKILDKKIHDEEENINDYRLMKNSTSGGVLSNTVINSMDNKIESAKENIKSHEKEKQWYEKVLRKYNVRG